MWGCHPVCRAKHGNYVLCSSLLSPRMLRWKKTKVQWDVCHCRCSPAPVRCHLQSCFIGMCIYNSLLSQNCVLFVKVYAGQHLCCRFYLHCACFIIFVYVDVCMCVIMHVSCCILSVWYKAKQKSWIMLSFLLYGSIYLSTYGVWWCWVGMPVQMLSSAAYTICPFG